MQQILRIAQLDNQHWYNALPLAEIAINNAPIRETPYTHFYLNTCFHLCFTADVFNFHNPSDDTTENANDYIHSLHQL